MGAARAWLPGLGLWIALATAGTLHAQDAPASAEDLFRAGDYEGAAERWRAAAMAGSAEATFRLAQMSDLGLGMPRDPDRALDGYIEAGLRGHVAAQFNAGAMFEIGADTPRDARRAAFWYTLAASAGHARSAYDLGVAFARGDGVPRNGDLARYWLDRASPTLEAAARARAELGDGARGDAGLAAPEILGANVMRTRDGWRIDLAWAAPPGPEGSLFLVEVAIAPARPGGGATVASRGVEASAAGFEVARDPSGLVWRVSRVTADRSGYADSPWAAVTPGAGLPADPLPEPGERVAIRVGPDDPAARRFAEELSRTLSDGRAWPRVEALADPPAESGVAYGYGQDADLAREIAVSLPVFEEADARRIDRQGIAPGEVVVTLVGGPATAR